MNINVFCLQGSTGSRASGLPLQSSSSSSSCSNATALQGGIKRTTNRTPQSSGAQLRQPPNLDPTKNKRFSKSSEEDSAYAGFGSSSSPISSAESSSMSINSTSSRNSSGSGTTNPRVRTLTALTFHQTTANHRFIGGTIQPPSSPHVN
ncbi:unnamed protein product [Onchocerca flexuosa]|uniref:Dual-specificity kinase n=1 Tax=Onchocerca flexuosa TaxID=387005 RepID=A0A183I5S3_9BILA|nr:unnamed protein product [Onchocerca flexuosa]